jgi:hypothetical protein
MVGRLCVLFVVLRVLSLGQTRSIEGQVCDAIGAVIPHASVVLRVEGAPPASQTTTTDFNGHFRFTGVAPGTYEVLVSMQGFVDYVQSVSIVEGKDTELPAISLAIGPIAECADYTLELPTITFVSFGPSEAQLDGSAATPAGELLADVTISLRSIGHPSKPLTTRTDIDGKFSFRGVKPGAYALRSSRRGYSAFVIDRVEIRLGQRAHISEPLEMDRCPAGIHCRPSRTIHVPNICL